jgi:putative nucleotidyltransferase with HDIG domain
VSEQRRQDGAFILFILSLYSPSPEYPAARRRHSGFGASATCCRDEWRGDPPKIEERPSSVAGYCGGWKGGLVSANSAWIPRRLLRGVLLAIHAIIGRVSATKRSETMKCPGQDSRYWKPDAIFEIPCPKCGHIVEFFKDDTARNCSRCSHRFVNPNMDFGCAAYCEYAEQCLGTLPPELLARKEDLLKDRVAIAMKRYFKRDFKRIGHAMRVARYAERIGKQEKANPAVILTAAYLHDIGIPETERKYGSNGGERHGQEGVPIAREIMSGLDANEDLIDKVCDIIGRHHHPNREETLEFKVCFDADRLANLEEEQKEGRLDTDRLEKIVASAFLTETGRKEAEKILLEKENK